MPSTSTRTNKEVMRSTKNRFNELDDNELIARLTAVPPDEELHSYFFGTKCKQFLRFIAVSIFNNNDTEALLGEFYDLISKNNWNILRLFDKSKGASLNTYLSRCAVRHFIELKSKEEKRLGYRCSIEERDIIKELDHFTLDEEEEQPDVWRAFANLKERDKIILRSLVLENRSTLEVADQIWPYVKTQHKNWRELPAKRVQDCIAILKKRALLSLAIEIKRISNDRGK